jgi:predicted DNA-binding transcriptional regulator YafY
MMGAFMKIDRLLGITIHLLNHDKSSAKILASKFEVSLRTIQRDIESLCQAGIPVVSYVGAEGGYKILESFKMDRQIAGDVDYQYIILALQGLASAYENPKVETTLEKMKSVFNSNKLDLDIVLDFSILKEVKNINENLKILEHAIAEKCGVSFDYTNIDNITTTKTIEPIAVVYKWYSWYLLGYSLEKKDYRLYKLVRMKKLALTNRSISKVHESVDILLKKNYEKDTRKYIDIKLFCKSEVKMKAIEYLNGSIEFEYENGDFIMNLHLPESEQLWFGTLLSLGNLVKVIEPEELKNRLRSKCIDIINLYT